MTYVGNVVHAHVIACDRLVECSRMSPTQWRLPHHTVYEDPVEYSTLTVGNYRIPTSEAKPLGPVADRQTSASEVQAEALFRDPTHVEPKPVTRTKFDPWSDDADKMENVILAEKAQSEKSGGELPPSPFLPDTVEYTAKGTSLPHPSSVLTPNLLQVPGQAFFITNGEPVYFWDFSRMVWKELGDTNESGSR